MAVLTYQRFGKLEGEDGTMMLFTLPAATLNDRDGLLFHDHFSLS